MKVEDAMEQGRTKSIIDQVSIINSRVVPSDKQSERGHRSLFHPRTQKGVPEIYHRVPFRDAEKPTEILILVEQAFTCSYTSYMC